MLDMEKDHAHCVCCFNQRCMVRPQPGISCELIYCPTLCGAVFHSCKADEHRLICPLVRVPCLNSSNGCPASIVRNQLYAHLEVCPAGVVSCTMEWNRWPVSCLDYTSYESLSQGVEQMEQLDMALALQDQRTLVESLKVIAVAPSVTSTWGEPPSQSPSQEPESLKEKINGGIHVLNEQRLSRLYEATVETARSLAAALEIVGSISSLNSGLERGAARGRATAGSTQDPENGLEDNTANPTTGLLGNGTEEQPVCSTGLNRSDCNVVNTTNGPASAAADTTVEATQPHIEKDEAIATPEGAHAAPENTAFFPSEQCPRTYDCQFFRKDNQCSLANGHISFTTDESLHRSLSKMENKSVDTSDLGQDDDSLGLGETDLISAALLFCLEESRECRRISDTVYVDAHRVDFGTQTFPFPAAILVTNTRVGDMASASACDHAAPQLSYPSPFHTLRLGLVLEALEGEALPYNRYLPAKPHHQHMFPFVCGQSFRRDQFSSHFTNVHGDIHAGLNGWMEQRCPLAYYGCTFSQRRFYPSVKGARVVHDRHLRSFGVRPCPDLNVRGAQPDQFSGLPFEILRSVAGYLDSFSLCQLSLVSRTLREVCSSLLQTRGIVELQWERRRGPSAPGTVSWQVKNKVWRFSTAFSPVLSWRFSDLPSMSHHLQTCHFNIVEHKTEPVPLPAMSSAQDGQSLRCVLRHIN
uniref:F-box protein 30b n=1 Tax=Tetraodon nigroviridis TaxID=99883 RepID=H3D3Y5_TETNG